MRRASQKSFAFHPLVADWFQQRFPGGATTVQTQGWPAIAAGGDTLIAAPTGSGKTLTAFLVCIDHLVRQALAGQLEDQTQVLYVSPLKALATDVRKNLEGPLAEIMAKAAAASPGVASIRVFSRSGDTPASQRAAMVKRPPHIVVTTPESLYLLLTSTKGRALLRTVRTVIIDEIHALARDKRGSHLALSLARLDRLCAEAGGRPQRLGLSATQKPIAAIAAFLVGAGRLDAAGRADCTIIDTGHQRQIDLAVEVPPSDLGAVCSHEQWDEVYRRLAELVRQHRSTLIFVNTRKLAERVAYHLASELGEDQVASHHGSLSKELRLAAEDKLKAGKLNAIVATASLELGIDVGFIDLVCQIGSPRSIATFLQRVGRAGHAVGALPKGRLFALTRDELLEALALVHAVRQGQLDQIIMPIGPIDILAQQVVAEVAAVEDIGVDELYQCLKTAYPYRDLSHEQFTGVVAMLAEGFARGRQKYAYLHHDRLAGRLRSRRGARLLAVTSGGAIPEQGEFRVINIDDNAFVGTVNEDFALESAKGDIFLLGSTSWQIQQVRGADVLVRDMQGAPPSIPFWLGEAPGRTLELSGAVSDLRAAIDARLALPENRDDPLYRLDALTELKALAPAAYGAARAWLTEHAAADDWASLQAVHYVAVQKAALGLVPTRRQVVFERFFDTMGGMQLVIHAPFGMRINKGWGLALRKRFCRSFDFELQAAADNDGIVLSLGPQHSFPIEQLFRFLNPTNVQGLLEQAILQVPLFQIRWRWNTNRALAVPRQSHGQRVPPALQRFRADDLMTAVFPAQTQCKENVTGDIPLPDHPLVRQTMHDCLHEAIDLPALRDVLAQIQDGTIELIARDTREPSPFAYQLLNANPYAFLDDAPLEERRARAVATRRSLGLGDFTELARLNHDIAAQVGKEAWPQARDADELHGVLCAAGVVPEAEVEERSPHWAMFMQQLVDAGRAGRLHYGGAVFWLATEALDLVEAAYGDVAAQVTPRLQLPLALRREWSAEDARLFLLRAYLEVHGITSAEDLARQLSFDLGTVEAALPALEGQGEVLRGRFFEADGPLAWCDRRLLMRMHKLTLDSLRRQIKPVTPAVYWRFLSRHQHLLPETWGKGRQGLLTVLEQLQGFDAAAGSWESELLPSRVEGYQPAWLDELTHQGVIAWARLRPEARGEDEAPSSGGMTRAVPLALFRRDHLPWIWPGNGAAVAGSADAAVGEDTPAPPALRANAQAVHAALSRYGAQFAAELRARTGLLETQLDESLGELARLGLAQADGFAAIRPLVSKSRQASQERHVGVAARFFARPSYAQGGRWALFPPPFPPLSADERAEAWAWLLLQRYGIVWRDLLGREGAAPAWGDLARVYRRLEMRGEIRGGRFVVGEAVSSGEQFALPNAVEQLRTVRDEGPRQEVVVISAADPLNLQGIITPGPRIASSRLRLMVFVDGEHAASRDGDDIEWHGKMLAAPTLELARQMLQLSGVFRGKIGRSHELTRRSAP